jgi:hypothetical protein
MLTSPGHPLTALGPLLPAHGVGSRQDLPVPFGYALIGAAIALIVSFLALAVLWKTPKLRGAVAGIPLPAPLAAAADAPLTRTLLRAVGLLLTAVFLVGLVVGPDVEQNPSAGIIYVIFWVGTLVVSSVVFGPVWRLLNPLRTIHLLACRLLRADPRHGAIGLSPRVGRWPAALAILSFAWLELVAPNRDTLFVLRTYVLLYAVWVLWGAALCGERWFAAADGFEVMSSTYARVSLFGRRADGRLVFRSPLDGLSGMPSVPGTAAVVSVLLGTTAFDGMSAATWWYPRVRDSSLPPEVWATGGLFGMVLLVGATFTLACRWSARLGRTPADRPLTGELAHSVVPIALGYAVAHYYSLLVVAGQLTFIQLSDPLVRGDNWLGLSDRQASYALVAATVVAVLQVVSVVTGHIVGVVLAHDRSIALAAPGRAVLAQLPVLLLMVGYTLGGLTLLFSA